MSVNRPTRIVFICLGNICRSPTAEAVFLRLARERGVLDGMTIESRGTGDWHVGEAPDPRARAAARRHGVELRGTARQLSRDDLARFDLFVCMDRRNAADVRTLGGERERIVLLRDFDPQAESPDVPDPYFGEDEEAGFAHVYAIIERSCAGLLAHLEKP